MSLEQLKLSLHPPHHETFLMEMDSRAYFKTFLVWGHGVNTQAIKRFSLYIRLHLQLKRLTTYLHTTRQACTIEVSICLIVSLLLISAGPIKVFQFYYTFCHKSNILELFDNKHKLNVIFFSYQSFLFQWVSALLKFVAK